MAKPDIAALKSAAETAEKEYSEAYVIKERALADAREKWRVAASAHARYKRAQAKMELNQMRAGITDETS